MSTSLRSRVVRLVAGSGILAMGTVVALRSAGAPTPAQAIKSEPARAAYMHAHFGDVMTVHDAVIRGDLAAVKAPATSLAEAAPPASLPGGTEGLVARLREAAGRAAAATTVPAAASATASMLQTCGDCHRQAGTLPAAPVLKGPEVGGIVGHMLEHQHAIDQLLVGLVTPSSSMWRAGAEGLMKAPLHPDKLPDDPKLTSELKASEVRIHEIASQAAKVEDSAARATFYGQLLARCADCHSLHRKVWGPSRK